MILAAIVLIAGCATPMTLRQIQAVKPNCARIDRQIAALEKEKAENDQRLLAGIQSVAPALAALNLVAGTYGRNVAIATGAGPPPSTASSPNLGAPRSHARCRQSILGNDEGMTRRSRLPLLLRVAGRQRDDCFGAEPEQGKAAAPADAPLALITVAGAPGDGEQALSAALAKRLSAIGIKPANAFGAECLFGRGRCQSDGDQRRARERPHRLDGVRTGRQHHRRRLADEVRAQGVARKRWGGAADAAARAAAGEIAKLIPR